MIFNGDMLLYNMNNMKHYLRCPGWPRTSVSKCVSSRVNCSWPSVIWSKATRSKLFS